MPEFKDPARGRPATIQQLNATLCEDAGVGGRIVRLADEDYTVSKYDRLLILTASTSSADHTITFDPNLLADGQEVMLLMPAAPTGTDGFVTSGLSEEMELRAAGAAASVLVAGSVAARASATPEAGSGGVTRVADDDYTVLPSDEVILLAATTSTGNYTLTFASGFPDGHTVKVALPEALGGTDGFDTDGIDAAEDDYDTAGQAAEYMYCATEDVWVKLGTAAP